MDKVYKSDDEWRRILTPEQYRVTRCKGTEPPFSGQYYDLKAQGRFRCVCCGQPLFGSEAKYDSGSGWPSFWAPLEGSSLEVQADFSLCMRRDEVLCGVCGAHLGHVFPDGPPPTGLRYCINSVALKFEPGGGQV